MKNSPFPTIDPEATGRRITYLRKQRGLTVKDLRDYFNFADVRIIYKWQRGECLPSLDSLYALSSLFGVTMDYIIVGSVRRVSDEPQATACGSSCG